MKNIFNSLLLGVLLVSVNSYGADFSTDIPTATITSIAQGAIHLTSLEVINNNPSNIVNVWFYDAPTNAITWSRGAYTNWTTYTTNIVVTTTNYQGVVETSTNLATFTLPLANGAATATYELLKSFTVGIGGTTTWNPSGGVYLSYGLASTNNQTNITVNSTYSNTK